MAKRRLLVLLIAFAACIATSIPSHATSGSVSVEIARGGLIVGGGAGRGVLSYHGRNHRFRVYGLTFGASAGLSTSRLTGSASNLHQLGDFAGTYTAVAIGGAWFLGGARVRLTNEKGVTITLDGIKAGLELTANVSRISIEFE